MKSKFDLTGIEGFSVGRSRKEASLTSDKLNNLLAARSGGGAGAHEDQEQGTSAERACRGVVVVAAAEINNKT